MGTLSNPYVGPRAYESHETLYGRDREIRQLMALLVAERIVLLHSPSGAGKTSLLQAGLLPRMQADDFYVLPTVRVNLEIPNPLAGMGANRYLLSTLLSLEEDVPQERCLQQADLPGLSLDAYLERRCRPEGASPSELLVFDQFEEVLTVAPSDREGKLAFFEQVGAALRNRNRWAIFAMREDYVAALAPYLRPIPDQLAASFRLDLLGCEAARQAIQKPAQSVGVDFRTEAAEKLVADLSQVQEQAPDGSIETKQGLYVEPVQLQVVCYRLWDAHAGDDRAITLADLGQVGSVDDSLAAYYTESVARVAASAGIEERAIREWFGNRLITPEGIRSQVLQRADASDGLDNRAILQLVDTHIVRSEKRAGSTWFELAHDRMIAPVRQSNAAWFKANLRAFQVQAGLWDQQGRGEGLLLRGKALVDARKEAHSTKLTPVEKAFLAACVTARKREEREKRLTRIITIAAVVATIAMIAAVGFAIYAEGQRQTAQEATGIADQQRQEAQDAKGIAEDQRTIAQTAEANAKEQAKIALSRQLMAQSQRLPESLSKDYALKGLLAVQASRLNADLESDALRSFLQIPGQLIVRIMPGAPVNKVVFSPNGRHVASVSGEKTVQVWDAGNGSLVGKMDLGDRVSSIALNKDGAYLAVISNDGNITVVETEGDSDMNPRKKVNDKNSQLWRKQDGSFSALAFDSKDNLWVAIGARDKSVQIWNVTTGDPPVSVNLMKEITEFDITSLAISPDKNLVAAGTTASMIYVTNWSTGDQKILNDLYGSDAVSLCTIYSVAINDNSVISGNGRGSVIVWSQPNKEKVSYITHNARVNAAAFSRDGQYVVSGIDDGTARVWNAYSGEEVSRMIHDGGVTGVDFSSDNQRVVSGSQDGTIWVWDALANKDWVGVQEPPVDGMISEACMRVNRSLTQAEWEFYIDKSLLPYDPNTPTCVDMSRGG